MIAIWGAGGFIGQNLTYCLAEAGTPLRLFSRSPYPHPLPANAQMVQADFGETDSYWAQMEDCETVILLVSASRAGTLNEEQETLRNVRPYENFLNALSKRPGRVKHVIYVSSGGAVYGITPACPVTEKTPLHPVNAYGKAKVGIENMIFAASINAPWSHTVLRVANPAGRWGMNQGLIAAAIRAAKNGHPLPLSGDGSTVRDFFDVRELADGIKTVMGTPACRGNIYNMGAGKGHSLRQVVDIVQETMGRRIEIVYNEPWPHDVPYNVLDSGKIHADTGWRARRELKEIIIEMSNAS